MNFKQFARIHKVRMTVDWIDRRPDGFDSMPPGSNHYRCVLRHKGKQMTVYYSKGPALHGEPELHEVLACIASDAAGYENARGFADWCGEYGYDPSVGDWDDDTDEFVSKDRATYDACGKTRDDLVRLFGVGVTKTLMFDTEED